MKIYIFDPFLLLNEYKYYFQILLIEPHSEKENPDKLIANSEYFL